MAAAEPDTVGISRRLDDNDDNPSRIRMRLKQSSRRFSVLRANRKAGSGLPSLVH